MEKSQYSEPVSALLTYGHAHEVRSWSQYQKLGFSQKDIPELIAILKDKTLHNADSTSDEVWAPIHAWRVLGQLKAVEAIPALLDQLYRIDEDDDDWIGEEFPEVFALIGPPSISALHAYLANSQHLLFARICTTRCLSKIGQHDSNVRLECIACLEEQLRQSCHNDLTLNGFIVSSLLDLKAVEALPSIQAAFRDKYIDLNVAGDCEDAEIELGVRKERTTPRPHLGLMGNPESVGSVNPPRRSKKKIGRNASCPCGSGKKYKKCCMGS